MPVEEFKRCINSNVLVLRREREVETFKKVARLADDYTLTHKTNPRKPFCRLLVLNQVLVSSLVIPITILPKPKPPGENKGHNGLSQTYLQLLQTIRAGCSKLMTLLVNVSLKFQTLISKFAKKILEKSEELLHCEIFSHFFSAKILVYLVIRS